MSMNELFVDQARKYNRKPQEPPPLPVLNGWYGRTNYALEFCKKHPKLECYMCHNKIQQIEDISLTKIIKNDTFHYIFVICNNCHLKHNIPEAPRNKSGNMNEAREIRAEANNLDRSIDLLRSQIRDKKLEIKKLESISHDLNNSINQFNNKKKELETVKESTSELCENIVEAYEKIEKHQKTFDRLTVQNNNLVKQIRETRESREERKREIARENESIEQEAYETLGELRNCIKQETDVLNRINDQKIDMLDSLSQSAENFKQLLLKHKSQIRPKYVYTCRICEDAEGIYAIECGHIYCQKCVDFNLKECSFCKAKPQDSDGEEKNTFDILKLYYA